VTEWWLGHGLLTKVRRISPGIWLPVCLVTVSLVLTLVAYGPVLRFPFTFDDPIHLRWLEGRGILDPWVGVSGLQRYRPLVLSLWAASGRAFGLHNPLPLHVVSLLLHVGSATLVGSLAHRFVSGATGSVVAVVLFTLFPFSYQALPSPGSQSKPLSAFLILLACLLYWEGRTRSSRATVFASLVPALLAPFAYEGGTTAGGALLLIEYVLWRKRIIQRPSPWAMALLLVGFLFVAAWLLVPKSSDLGSFPGWEALWQSSVYFVQALTWPVSLLAKPVMRWTGLADQAATTLVAYPALALLAGLFCWRRRADMFLAYVAWYVLALIVQWVVLPFGYVIDGPRMLYTASAGAAWLWADLLTTTLPVSSRWWGWASVGVVLVAMTGWSLEFITERMELCRAGLSALSEATSVAVERPPDDVQLFLNLPSWVAPRQRGFALGHEGYTLLPEYTDIGLDDFVYVNTGVRREAWVMSLPDIRDPWVAEIGTWGPDSTLDGLTDPIRHAGRVWVLEADGDDLVLADAGSVGPASVDGDPDGVKLAVFGEAVALQDLLVQQGASLLTVQLHWRSLHRMLEPYTVFVHVYDGEGQLSAQGDGLPLGGTFPFAHWEPGDRVRDARHIVLPEGACGRGCMLGVGLYRGDVGERAPATDAGGDALAERMYRISLEAARGD
jgi:hypothetical protein